MGKKLCERVNAGQLDNKLDKYLKKVGEPEYICLKCGRVAEKKESLCKPGDISDLCVKL